MKVKSIRYAGKADVYNMEVADTHDYAIESGVIVHNCRYVVMLTKPKINAPKRLPARRKFDPLGFGSEVYDGDDKGKMITLPEIKVG